MLNKEHPGYKKVQAQSEAASKTLKTAKSFDIS